MKERMPRRVCGRMLAEHRRPDSPGSVPTDFSAELFFDGGVSAHFYCSFVTGIQQWANVAGTKGYLYVPDFVLPYYGTEAAFQVTNAALDVQGCDFNMEDRTRRIAVREYSHAAASAQETNMFREFAEKVLSGKPDPHWGQIALRTQQVSDACLQSARDGGRTIELAG